MAQQLLERIMHNPSLGPGGFLGGGLAQQPPPSAFSAYQPAAPGPGAALEQNPFLVAAQAAQALTAAHLGLMLNSGAGSGGGGADSAPPLPPPHGQLSPRSDTDDAGGSAGSDTDDDPPRAAMPRPASTGVAGLKIPVTCNDVRGLVYLDQQVVGCYCPACEARVAAGHDRPLFSFTRFERHCGSKAKKWRLSLRIEPGTVKECPPGDGPMPLGQWMELRGLISWGARSSVKIGLRESDEDDGLQDLAYQRRPAVGPMHMQDRRAAGALAVLAGATSALSGREREGGGNAPSSAGREKLLPLKRDREEYETPDLPDQANREAWLEEQRRRFEATAAAGGDGSGAPAALAAKHGAIFKLVYGLLEGGADRRAFNEDYLPWLNELPAHRLEQEFNTLQQYLQLLGDMPWQAVQGLMRAYLKAILARVGGQK